MVPRSYELSLARRRSQGAPWSSKNNHLTRIVILNTTVSTRLWRDIWFLVSLREAYITFIAVAYQLPAFTLGVASLRKIPKPKPPLGNFAETFELVGLELDDESIRRYVRDKCTVVKATNDFENIQAQKPCIHTRYKYYSEHEDVFQYPGYTEHSRFMCTHGAVRTRGYRGKLYNYTGNTTAVEVELVEDTATLLHPVTKPLIEMAESSIRLPATTRFACNRREKPLPPRELGCYRVNS